MAELKIIIGNKRYSSWSLRGWLAIEHTGIPFSEVKLELDTATFYDEIIKYSPAKRVPTLIDNDITVWDSAAIIDYCAMLSPDKYWWPTDKTAYALARSIFNEMHSGFPELRTHAPMNLVGRWQNLIFSDAIKTEVRRIVEIWSNCREQHGSDGDFLFGAFSAADMMFAPITARLATYGMPVNQISADYITAVRAHSAVNAWFEDAGKETGIVMADLVDKNATHIG